MSHTYGELCAGYGGLFSGVQSVLGGDLKWYSEFDPAPSKVMAYHHPDAPNIGDMTKVDWHSVEPVDVLAGGYPCQPFSHAGKRAGTNDERHLWPNIAEAVAVLRPGLCVFENVRGHLSLGFDGVLRDLEQLGYSVRWYTLRAADIGAAHGRARLFIFAEDTRNEHRVCGRPDRRRGLDRDHESSAWGDLRDQPQGQHVGQGQARTGCAGGTPWREGHTGRSRDGHSTQHVPLAVDGEGSRGGAQTTGAPPAHQGSALPDRTGTRGDGRGRSGRTGRGQEVEHRDERTCRDAQVADQGSESTRPGPGPANPAESEAGGGLQPRVVVGAGRRPVRAGGVSGEPADVRSDGCWACVRDALLERARGTRGPGAATPANAGGLGGLEAVQHDGRGSAFGYGAGVPHQSDRDVVRSGPERDLTLLPTPAVNDMGASYTPETWDAWTAKMQAAHGNGNGHGKSLSLDAQRLLPTPVSDNSRGLPSSGTDYASLPNAVVNILPTPTSADANSSGGSNASNVTLTDATVRTRMGTTANERLLPTPRATDGTKGGPNQRGSSGDLMLPSAVNLLPTPMVGSTSPASHGQISGDYRARMAEALDRWGDYSQAIARWGHVIGRAAPPPTELGAARLNRHGNPSRNPRLSPGFVEWLMGLPAGHVTSDDIGLTRNQQLKALGNGVVPQQAAAATRAWLEDMARGAVA